MCQTAVILQYACDSNCLFTLTTVTLVFISFHYLCYVDNWSYLCSVISIVEPGVSVFDACDALKKYH